MRSIGNESALPLEGIFQPVQQLIEGDRQLAKFVAWIGYAQTIVKVRGADGACLGGHCGNGGKTFAGKKISAQSGKEEGNRNNQEKSGTDVL